MCNIISALNPQLSSSKHLKNNPKIFYHKFKCNWAIVWKRRTKIKRNCNSKLLFSKLTRQNTRLRCARTGLNLEYAGIQTNVNLHMATTSLYLKSHRMKDSKQRLANSSTRKVSVHMEGDAFSNTRNVSLENCINTSMSTKCST
jgi:hypothetical protein